MTSIYLNTPKLAALGPVDTLAQRVRKLVSLGVDLPMGAQPEGSTTTTLAQRVRKLGLSVTKP
jgi:hypothetical protein